MGPRSAAATIGGSPKHARDRVEILSRDGHSAVEREDLACNHAGFVTRKIKCHACNIARLNQTQQMRVGKSGQGGVPAIRFLTRSVIVADGAIALTRAFWAYATTRERVIAAIPPFAAV
jgi:hypothetical protein